MGWKPLIFGSNVLNLAIIFILHLSLTEAVNSVDLYKHLFAKYTPQLRPVMDDNNILGLNVKFLLRGISEFDEVGGQFSLATGLDLRWKDEYLTWNFSRYPIKTLILPENEIWTPKLSLANPTDRILLFADDMFNVRIYPNGGVIWLQGGTIRATCKPNVRRYPFDIHYCHVTILPLNYVATEIKLIPEVDLSTFDKYGEWELGNWTVETKLFGGYFSSIVLNLNVKRRPEFSLLSIIIPILFLGVLNACVFLLPVESGERVSYAITVLLSFAVFLTIVSAMMPKNSDPVPILCYVLTIMMALSGLIMFFTILNLRCFYHSPGTPVPSVLQLMCRKPCQNRKQKSVRNYNHCRVKDNDNGLTTVAEDDCSYGVLTWQGLSSVFDVILFWSFLLLFFATVVVYLLLVYSYD